MSITVGDLVKVFDDPVARTTVTMVLGRLVRIYPWGTPALSPGSTQTYCIRDASSNLLVLVPPDYVELFSPPSISVQPVAVEVSVGGVVELNVTSSGSNAKTFRWFADGALIEGGVSAWGSIKAGEAKDVVDGPDSSDVSVFTITNAQKVDSGRYWCVVQNAADKIVTNKVQVLVT